MTTARTVLLLSFLGACGDDDGAPAIDGPPAGTHVTEDFDGGWDAWDELGGVAAATVADGRGVLRPEVTTYSLGRMGHALDAIDVDVRYDLAMVDPAVSGVGFYVRQNGGYLQATTTPGGGYAVFVEGFSGPRIGLWAEREGSELEIVHAELPALDAGATYEVRFTCSQDGSVTRLQAKLWPSGEAEPAAWSVTATDDDAALQDVSGGIAVDVWSQAMPGGTAMEISVDAIDVEVLR